MSYSTTWDSREIPLYLPYNRILNELEEEPIRLTRGENAYVTLGGKLAKRPGTILLTSSNSVRRVSRMWLYETLDKPSLLYIVASVLNPATGRYRMEYIRLDAGSPTWTSFGTLRDIDKSTVPHEVGFSRGKVYVKGTPDGTQDKLCAVIFDGTGGSVVVSIWGLLPPTEPAHVVGAITKLNGAVTAAAVTINVDSDTGFPTVPFNIQVDFERMTVTAGLPGTAWTVTRSIQDTVAAVHRNDAAVLWRNWVASDHQVDVNFFWQYMYAGKTLTKHYSSRSPVETNPDKLPSRTGPFRDLKPVMQLKGFTDTTNIPTLAVFRTTDGGGAGFFLEELANPGATTVNYIDDSLGTGASSSTFNDPLPDQFLDTALFAPSEDSNNPPPTVTAPSIVGTTAVRRSTPIAFYSGRFWYGVDNILFFSGDEEVSIGIPEESWFYGTNGNFFRLPTSVVNVKETDDALYVFTLQATYQITGTNLATFNVRPIFDNLGAPVGHPGAITRFGGVVALLTHDFRIALISGGEMKIISDPLFTDIIDAVNAGGRVELAYFGDLEKEWLVVASHNDADPSLSRQWIYDLKLSAQKRMDFWSVPWTLRSTAMLSGRIAEGQSQRRLVFHVWDPAAAKGRLVRIDPTLRTGQDVWGDGSVNGYDFDAVTSLFRVPSGDHVNTLRVPGAVPSAYQIVTERLTFTGMSNLPDRDPAIYYFWDDLYNDPISVDPAEEPARRRQSIGYRTATYPLNTTGQRLAVEILKKGTKDLFQLCNLTVGFAPNSGV